MVGAPRNGEYGFPPPFEPRSTHGAAGRESRWQERRKKMTDQGKMKAKQVANGIVSEDKKATGGIIVDVAGKIIDKAPL